MSDGCILQLLRGRLRNEERSCELLLFPFLLLRPVWLLVNIDQLNSWRPSGRPGRFIPCGRQRAMGRNYWQQEPERWLPFGLCCKCLRSVTVCHRHMLILEQRVVISTCLSLHILFFYASLISVLKTYLSCEVCLIWFLLFNFCSLIFLLHSPTNFSVIFFLNWWHVLLLSFLIFYPILQMLFLAVGWL